jgi:DNA-binding winged helix-turn-helix (wHTH) protein
MVYAFGEFELDDQLYQLRCAGEAVKVEPQVFKLLAYLIVHRDRVLSREELFEQLWPGQVVSEAALTYCMAKARKAVHDNGIRQHIIKTQHGQGYRFVAQVTVHATTQPLVTISLSEDHTLAVRPPLHPSWQSRRLVAVCLLFVFGWMTSLWQLSFRPSSTFVVFPGERRAVSPEVTPTEGKLCRWWVLSTTSHAALDSLLRGWDFYNLRTPEGDSQARQMFQRAIDLDPGYAAAYASLG